MTQQELKQIFQNPYQRKPWLEVLNNVFSKVDIFAQPQDLFNDVDSVIEGSQIGLIQLTDDKNIAIFEVEVADNISILHNRKGLRDIAAKHIDQGIIHGALVFFYSQCQSEYRFTFIAKHTEFDDEGNLNKIQTHPKRYTYVLGTPYCGTAVQRISSLAGKNQLTPLVIKDVIEAFSVEALTKEFYSELSNWYFWALQNVKFPDDFEQDEEVRNATSTIRLITRLMFVWFLKQKGLIPNELFEPEELSKILKSFNPKNPNSDNVGSTFYKAILQNLFFATLNQEMGKRAFRREGDQYNITNIYRYKNLFTKPEEALKLFENIPFLNGGLFECLDKPHPTQKTSRGAEVIVRVDGFSDRDDNKLSVPDYLFFDGAEHADLNRAYGDSTHGNTKVRGLIEILKSYNFTIEENTPYEIEVALDPELLGKVFENLLASYNPETKTTARKQTGSFYTPREIVNYMVDESIVAYLKSKLIEDAGGIAVIGNPQIELFGNETRKGQLSLEQKINSSNWVGKETELEDNLRLILAYNGDENPFDAKDTALLIKAIDNCKILDPACGSGAFPMGVLQKMVHILQKLDKDNSQWRELQRQKAIAETEKAYNIGDKDERQKRLLDIDETFDYNASDYGRKLYLIENCIYGVDIQPIAVQIAKLRFFISLVCDQKDDKNRENLGIRPLPNLETKFVAANSLIGINRSGGVLRILEVVEKEKELAEVRHKHFLARTPETKAKYRKKDEELRHHIASLLKNNGWGDAVARLLADWNPYDQNISASFFDPEWMFGLSSEIVIQKSNVPSSEIKALNLQLESINKQIDAINLSLQSNHAPEILKLQFVSANIQVSIIELEVNRLKNNIDELYGSVNSKVGNVVNEPVDVTYLINSLNHAIKQINKHVADFEAKLKPVQKIESHNGFDIVIGNPPYLKEGRTSKTVFDGVRISPYYQGKMDLWYMFACYGIDFLKTKGILCFIATNNWVTNGGASKMRNKIIKESKILQLVDFNNFMIFESASIQTMVMLFEKNKESDNYLFDYRKLSGNTTIQDAILTLNKKTTPKSTYLEPKIIRKQFIDKFLTFSSNEDILDKITNSCTFLYETEVAQGIVFPQDFLNKKNLEVLGDGYLLGESIFSLTESKLTELELSEPENRLIKPYFTTEQIHRYYSNSQNSLWLIYTDSSFKNPQSMNDYPRLKAHLDKFKNIITSDNKPYGLHRAREERFFKGEKILVLRKCSGKPVFSFSDFDCYVSATFYVIKTERINLKFLTGLLNSKLIEFWLKNRGKMQGENYQLDKEPLLTIPIKQFSDKSRDEVISLVDRILAAKKADPGADTLQWEAEIDARVFQLYGLTEEEMLQVLNSLPSVSEGERREIQAQWHLISKE